MKPINTVEEKELSKLTKLTKLTKSYLIKDIEASLWQTFKLVSMSQGLKIQEAIKQAIIEYIQNHKTNHQNIEVKIIENIEAKENLLQFIIEEEIRHQLKEILRVSPRLKKNPQLKSYINELKIKIINNVKRHPAISKDLAQEIKTVFQNLT